VGGVVDHVEIAASTKDEAKNAISSLRSHEERDKSLMLRPYSTIPRHDIDACIKAWH
jgi:hypothetical protein